MSRRFQWVIDGSAVGPNTEYDVDLLGDPRAAVLPSLGALVPYWLLAVPRWPVSCLRSMPKAERIKVLSLAQEVADRLPGDGETFFFEHGATTTNTPIGCGVDQAHLHITKLDFDLSASVQSASRDLTWQSAEIEDPWANIPIATEYYMLIGRDGASWAEASVGTSQFFRKSIADALDLADKWDYRAWYWLENVATARSVFMPIH